MSTLISFDAGVDNNNLTDQQLEKSRANGFRSYCNNCEFSNWCDKKRKIFMLQSTIEANELYNELEKSKNINIDELPDKIWQLQLIAERTLNNLSREKR